MGYAWHVLKLIVSVECVCRGVVRSSRSIASQAKPGGARRDRTDDLMLAKHALSQLSYGPYWFCEAWLARRSSRLPAQASPFGLRRAGFARWRERSLVGPGRVERPTSRLSGVRSNHLSYEPGSLTRRRMDIGPTRDRRKEEEKRRGRLDSHCLVSTEKPHECG